jgi:hypothetical protein
MGPADARSRSVHGAESSLGIEKATRAAEVLVLLVSEHALSLAPPSLREASLRDVFLKPEMARESPDVTLRHGNAGVRAAVGGTVEAVVEDGEGFAQESACRKLMRRRE